MSYKKSNRPGEFTPSNDTLHGGYKELFDATPESSAVRQRAIEQGQGMLHMGTKPVSEDPLSLRRSILGEQVYLPSPSILEDVTRQQPLG